jgi:hypothetical protein
MGDKMNEYGLLQGSGVDTHAEDYGTFDCVECGYENRNAKKITDDFGEWSVTCYECDTTYESGSIYDTNEDAETERYFDYKMSLDD